MSLELERSDLQILTALQRDSTISNSDLAQLVSLSTSACWRRVRALEEAGIIKSYGAQIDPVACGMGFHAIVHVQLTRHEPKNFSQFISTIRSRPEVIDCYATAGEADYHLRIMCRDLDGYNRFLEKCLFQIPGVASARTNLILREIKQSRVIPLNEM